jgi:hypothetical protein
MSEQKEQHEKQESTPDAMKKDAPGKKRETFIEIIEIRPGVVIEDDNGNDRWFRKL